MNDLVDQLCFDLYYLSVWLQDSLGSSNRLLFPRLVVLAYLEEEVVGTSTLYRRLWHSASH